DSIVPPALGGASPAGAPLDVFPPEPLPPESPLWKHPKVTITPHNAAQAVPQTLAMSVLQQIDRIELGMPPTNTIDRITGYSGGACLERIPDGGAMRRCRANSASAEYSAGRGSCSLPISGSS